MRVRLFLALTAALAVVGLTASTSAAEICPAQATIQTAAAASCYWPSVSVSVSPSSITEGQSATVSWSVTGADPAIGCQKGGAWSGGMSVDGGGNASGSTSVSPGAGTHTYSITCPANPEAGYGQAVLSVGSGGGPPPPPPPPPHIKIIKCVFNTNIISNMPDYVRGKMFGGCESNTYLSIKSTTCIQKQQWPSYYLHLDWENVNCASKTVWGLAINQPLQHNCDYTTIFYIYRLTSAIIVTDLSSGLSASKTSTTPWVGPGTCY